MSEKTPKERAINYLESNAGMLVGRGLGLIIRSMRRCVTILEPLLEEAEPRIERERVSYRRAGALFDEDLNNFKALNDKEVYDEAEE